MIKYLNPLFWVLPLSLCLAACGNDNEVAGIDASGAPVTSSTGTIDGFGSVIVNGVRYDSSQSAILVNGETGNENDLRVGYRVKITGTQEDDSGVAETIEFRPDLVGNITQIDIAKEQIIVLGQTIQITNTTIFDIAITPNSIEGLSVGERILISGQTDNNGVITATRIERSVQTHQINGFISQLNEANSRFMIRNITIDYSAAMFNDIEDNQLANGMHVSIRGSVNNAELFNAQYIKGIDDRFGDNIEQAKVEGFITRFTSATDFDVDGITCTTTTQTNYEDGSQTQLTLGAAVEITGSVNALGILVGQKIEFDRTDNNHVEGQVTAINLNTNGAVTTGTFNIGNTSIQTTTSTRYEDKSDSEIKRFNLSFIQVGDFLHVSGYTRDTIFVATKIERKDLDVDEERTLEIEGTVTSVGIHSFVVLGQEIITNAETQFNSDDSNLSEDEFLLSALNLHVAVKGTLEDGIFTAIEVEIEGTEIDEDE